MSKKRKAQRPRTRATQQDVGASQETAPSSGWTRRMLTAELLSDTHLGSGSGGGGIDALLARDRHDRPVIWASHVEGVLRDAARRLRGDKAAGDFFGRAAGQRQRAVFTSLYTRGSPESHVWRSTAREAFHNRAPKDDTLRVIEYVPKGTEFKGFVELPASELPVLQRLVQEVTALGGGRSSGAGRVKLELAEFIAASRSVGVPTERLVLLLKSRDPLCVTATATPGNLIPSLSFVPGRTLLGAVAAWLIAEGDRDTAALLTSGRVAVSDALPLPHAPARLDSVEVLPAPLSLRSAKPKGAAGDVPWWAQATKAKPRVDGFHAVEKGKRPEDDLFVSRAGPGESWVTFQPPRRVRLRNGRPDPRQRDPELFAIEQIAEETYFVAELRGGAGDMKTLAEKLAPVLEGRRWLRVGRAGAPVEVAKLAWSGAEPSVDTPERALLTLTSDLLVRDEHLRWRTALDEAALRALFDTDDLCIATTDTGALKAVQDSVPVHGFNGTSRLWRMPAAAIRRGSVYEVSGDIARLVERRASGQWLGERTHEGFGRFRLDIALPGVTDGATDAQEPTADNDEEAVAAKTHKWFEEHQGLARLGDSADRKPSLSQWFDLIADLERDDQSALAKRLNPTTAGAKSWRQKDAEKVLSKLQGIQSTQRTVYARFFVRWLRAEMRKGDR